MGVYTGTDNLEVMACAITYNAFLIDLIRKHLTREDQVLDLGAGIGTFAHRLTTLGYRVSCVEPEPDHGRLIEERGLCSKAALGDYPPDSFDIAYALNVLEHIDDDVAALRLLRSRLRVGGRLLVYVPALPFLYSSMDRKVGHVRRYTAATLTSVLTLARFQVRDWSYSDCLGVFATLLYMALGDKQGKVNKRALVLYDRVAFPLSRGLDRFLGRLGGKNLWALAVKVGGGE